jgi:transposase
VIVANPSAMFAGAPRRRRNDRLDAEFLARQGRADVALLHPITHRSAEAQQDLAGLRARDQLVAARTKLINHVRGAVKATGERLAACSAEAFAARATRALPAALAPALTPLVEVIGDLPRRIRQADAQLRISKAGDELGRRLLVSAAQYILGPFGPPCDLQRYGAAIAARGGTNAKKRAVVAVARKLAVLLHHLWISGATYAPDYQLNRRTPPPA